MTDGAPAGRVGASVAGGYLLWTAGLIEDRLIEAVETSMRMPFAGGPSSRSSFWPEHIPLYPTGMKVRVRPSPAEISRMDEALGWINDWLEESDRKLLRGWLVHKVARGKSVAGYAESAGMNSKTLRRFVIRCCQGIADSLNNKRRPLKSAELAEVSEKLVREQADSLPMAHPEKPKRSPGYVMLSPDARPAHDPSPEVAEKLAAEIARSNKRLRRLKRRAKKQLKTDLDAT